MTRSLLFLTCLGFLAGCGGGGAGALAPEPESIIELTTQKVIGLSSTYKAVFDCSASVVLNGVPVNATGTYLLETQTGTVTHPQTGVEGTPVLNDVNLSALGQSVQLTIREFIHVDTSGRWWSLGGEDASATRSWWSDDPPAVYPDPIGPIAGRILNQDESVSVGQSITVPPIDALSDDLSATLFTRSNTRDVISIEVIDTPLGRYECYRIEASETVDLHDGTGPTTIDYVRWERPEMGLLKLHAEGIQITYGTDTVTVNSFDCLIKSYRQ